MKITIELDDQDRATLLAGAEITIVLHDGAEAALVERFREKARQVHSELVQAEARHGENPEGARDG